MKCCNRDGGIYCGILCVFRMISFLSQIIGISPGSPAVPEHTVEKQSLIFVWRQRWDHRGSE